MEKRAHLQLRRQHLESLDELLRVSLHIFASAASKPYGSSIFCVSSLHLLSVGGMKELTSTPSTLSQIWRSIFAAGSKPGIGAYPRNPTPNSNAWCVTSRTVLAACWTRYRDISIRGLLKVQGGVNIPASSIPKSRAGLLVCCASSLASRSKSDLLCLHGLPIATKKDLLQDPRLFFAKRSRQKSHHQET